MYKIAALATHPPRFAAGSGVAIRCGFMREWKSAPPWVHTMSAHYLRTQPEGLVVTDYDDATPDLARGSARGFADDTQVTPMFVIDSAGSVTRLGAQRAPRRILGKLLFLVSIATFAVAMTVAGVRLWRDARPIVVPIPAAVASVDGGRLELAADRRTIVRVGHAGVQWTAAQPSALDSIEVHGAVAIGRTSGAISAIDVETGATRFAWELPAGERWAVQAPTMLGSCLFTLTLRGDDALARCLAIGDTPARWTAKIAGGRECEQPPVAVPGAYLVQCPGWTSVIDDRDGSVSVDADGIGLVQREPAVLLRGGVRPQLAAWSATTKRFARRGTPLRATIEAATSAVQHAGRVVIRAPSTSDKLAIIIPKTGAPLTIAVPEFQLADDAPLALDCGGGAPPRFQLLELAPRAGATFDPAAAQHRVLALLDTQAGRVAWTSRRIVPARRSSAAAAAICRHGHYFVPIELTGGAATSALWIVDAESGATSSALAFDAAAEASFASLTADQIDGERIVGAGRRGAFELRWRRGAPLDTSGLRDARGALEQALGRLP